MTKPPLFPGFDGLMTLSRREGVDIRPTLLRVLTDLYVQANAHSKDEEMQFVELTSRLIDHVDDATRASVRARLSIYPGTPAIVLRRLGVQPVQADQPAARPRDISAARVDAAPAAVKPVGDPRLRRTSDLSMQPNDAAEINDMFFRANSRERASILQTLQDTPLRPSARIPAIRAARAIEILQMAAFAADVENFTLEIGEALILPARIAAQVVDDPGGEPLACAARALNMPNAIFQQVLLFLRPEFGSSVHVVYRLSRLYDRLSERSALIMLAAWRGSTLAATRAKYRPGLYDDARNRDRPVPAQTRPAAALPAASFAVPRAGLKGSSR